MYLTQVVFSSNKQHCFIKVLSIYLLAHKAIYHIHDKWVSEIIERNSANCEEIGLDNLFLLIYTIISVLI